ncbi:hypothetical protein HW555_003238 [Spodoptera exigua]|uniref:Uncharacterized protein n=1 Tax=Spodoptera exigua TaxID=7107 RepID=A0A835GNV5_SPOEX|nr:hypothetical protein HW555_003238 [Spodoptera exigua]
MAALNGQEIETTESILKIKSLIDLFNETVDAVYYPLRELTIDEDYIFVNISKAKPIDMALSCTF